MSVIHTNLKLALVLALVALAPLACNNQKAELTEEEEELAAETQSDATPTRDNRSVQSGDAAFIKIFPDGDIIPTRGETATASVPVSATPASEPASATTPATSESNQGAPAPLEDAAPSTPTTEPSAPADETTEPATESPTPLTTDTSSSPAPEIAHEPAPAPAPAPAPSEEPTAISKELEDTSRPVLAVNESSASQLIAVLPKENKATVSIGKHSDFIPGAYAIFAKWTTDSKKVKVKVASDKADQDCAINEEATEGEWKTLGVFYLTKNAKVVITNNKNSSYAVKNELLLKPVIAENLTQPSKFKCLGGQIDGHGLVGFR